MRAIHLLPALAAIPLVGCADSESSGADGTGAREVTFHGEQAVLPGFSYDTGLLPESSPVQVRFTFAAGGGITADAKAAAGGDAIVGVPGSGVFKLDAHVKLEGQLKVDVSGLRYDGPIPGIENIDIAFGGETTFDPFLLDGASAKLTAQLPRLDLPPIPLPGGLPGALHITVTEASKLDSELVGRCAGLDGDMAQFLGATRTSATIVLAPKVVLMLPIVGTKEYPIPDITVPVPAIEVPMDFGQHQVALGGDRPAGAAVALAGGCSGEMGGGGGGGSGTCTASTDPITTSWHPPNGRDADACTQSALAAFDRDCMSDTATKETCQAFKAQHGACAACLISTDDSPGYGAIVAMDTMGILNVPGCVALVAPGQLACAKAMQGMYECLDTACSSCGADATNEQINSCLDEASYGTCAQATVDLESCVPELETGPAAQCFDVAFVADLFCGAP